MSRLHRTCVVGDCAKPVWSREMCRMHYYRWHKHGDPLFVQTKQSPAGAPAAFLASIPDEGEGCVTWPFAKNGVGYAQINTHAGRKLLVSRVVCERVHGPAPSLVHVAAHACGQGHKGCVAPWHLSWKTPAQNTADAVEHGTLVRGERQPTSKLTENDVRVIVQLLGTKSQSAIARQFGVSQRAISKIATGATWAHVTGARDV